MKFIVCCLTLVFFNTSVSFAESSDIMRESPASNRAWRISERGVEFNPDVRKEQAWDIRFNRQTFGRYLKNSTVTELKYKRLKVIEGRQGFVLLYVQAGDIEYAFLTKNYGLSWAYKALGTPKKGVSLSAGEAVDLNELDSTGVSAAASAPAGAGERSNTAPARPPTGGAIAPGFKALFDILLHKRPGLTPLTFDNFHTLFLVEYAPSADFQFSFEVNPTPRYYQLEFWPLSWLQLRAGRIWIPFDDMNPHNLFGGFVNVSRMMQPGDTAFLPDLWTDLGVATKFQLVETSSLEVSAHAYLVNGFEDGDADPQGQVGNKYPKFSAAPAVDNNSDKAFGGRLMARIAHMFMVGGSFYTARYTDEADESARMLLLGVDAGLRLTVGTEIKVGYLFGRIGLLKPASPDSFTRGGVYADYYQRLFGPWAIRGRIGAVNNDSRITATTDKYLLGGELIFDKQIFQVSAQFYHDFKDVATKVNRDFLALRLVVML